MITIEKHEYGEGTFRNEMCYLSSSGHVLRRNFLDKSNNVICDVLYEYDTLGRNIGGVVLDRNGDIHSYFEHIYTEDMSLACESIERDHTGKIEKRISYEFDQNGNHCLARFYDSDSYVGYCVLKYGADVLTDEQYFDIKGNRVDGLGIKSLWPI